MAATVSAHRRAFAKNPMVGHTKLRVASACVGARLFYLAGTWPKFAKCQLRKLQHALTMPHRCIAGRRHNAQRSDFSSDAGVRSIFRRPWASAHVVAARLRLLARLVRTTPLCWHACIPEVARHGDPSLSAPSPPFSVYYRRSWTACLARKRPPASGKGLAPTLRRHEHLSSEASYSLSGRTQRFGLK